MSSSKEYLNYVLEQLSETNDISYRSMMGEYIIYCRGRVVGGIYDDRFLIKPTSSAENLLADALKEIPYEGAKEMLLVDIMDDKERLKVLIEAVAEDLSHTKTKVKK